MSRAAQWRITKAKTGAIYVRLGLSAKKGLRCRRFSCCQATGAQVCLYVCCMCAYASAEHPHCDAARLSPPTLAGTESGLVYACTFGTTACPGFISAGQCDGNVNVEDGSGYCQCGYVGPFCSECDARYFLTWHGNEHKCLPCNDGEGWLPTILAGAFAVVCIALVAYAFTQKGLRKKLLRYYKIGKMKGVTLVQICQVVAGSLVPL